MKYLNLFNTILFVIGFIILIKIQFKIMAKIDDLQQLTKDLQASIDEKQQTIADAIAAFEKSIADLQAQLAAGSAATPEQLQQVIDDLTAAKADIEGTPTA